MLKMSPKRLGDDGADAVVGERPRRMLARRAAPEVAPGDEDRSRLVSSWLSTKSGRGGPVGVAAPVVEEELAVAVSLDALEELLGDDLVGVDVGAVERDERALLSAETVSCLRSRGFQLADVDEMARRPRPRRP